MGREGCLKTPSLVSPALINMSTWERQVVKRRQNLVHVIFRRPTTWFSWKNEHWKNFITLSRMDTSDWSKKWISWTLFKDFKSILLYFSLIINCPFLGLFIPRAIDKIIKDIPKISFGNWRPISRPRPTKSFRGNDFTSHASCMNYLLHAKKLWSLADNRIKVLIRYWNNQNSRDQWSQFVSFLLLLLLKVSNSRKSLSKHPYYLIFLTCSSKFLSGACDWLG